MRSFLPAYPGERTAGPCKPGGSGMRSVCTYHFQGLIGEGWILKWQGFTIKPELQEKGVVFLGVQAHPSAR